MTFSTPVTVQVCMYSIVLYDLCLGVLLERVTKNKTTVGKQARHAHTIHVSPPPYTAPDGALPLNVLIPLNPVQKYNARIFSNTLNDSPFTTISNTLLLYSMNAGLGTSTLLPVCCNLMLE